jgi:hypothetical protein
LPMPSSSATGPTVERTARIPGTPRTDHGARCSRSPEPPHRRVEPHRPPRRDLPSPLPTPAPPASGSPRPRFHRGDPRSTRVDFD